MDGYEVALFLHICGVVLLFCVIALILGPLAMARRTSNVAAVHVLARTADRMRWVLLVAAVVTFAAGGYMASKRNLWQRPWVSGAELVLLIVVVLQLALIAPRVAALTRAAAGAPEGAPSAALQRLALDPLLWLVCQMVSTITVGVIALMVFKPDGAGTGAVIAVSVVLGLLSGVPGFMRARRMQAQ